MTNQTGTVAMAAPSAPSLRRVLTLWDLVLYGIVLIMPIAPIPLFGVVQRLSGGYAVTTILLAMVAMTLTAFSYGRMAALYPSAGSAYTYVGRGLHPHLGFLAGWAMFLDYLLVPLICTIYGALTVQRLLPQVPYAAWALLFAAVMTAVNLCGIRTTMRTNLILMLTMCAVVVAFFWLAIRMLWSVQGWGGLISSEPFYTARGFSISAIATATSVAALTYGGFDGVSTLAEDVKNPRRNVLLATVLVCLFTGVFGGLQIYVAQRVWPDFRTFSNIETAFMDVTRVVGGALLFNAMAGVLILANLGAGLSAQAGVSRLLFGMARDGVLPRQLASLTKRNTPALNVTLVGMFAFGGALVLNYERAAELINFGAFLAFMGVNAAAMRSFYFRRATAGARSIVADLAPPALGLMFCLIIWLSLQTPAKIIGACWFAVGLVYDGWKTHWSRTAPGPMDFSK